MKERKIERHERSIPNYVREPYENVERNLRQAAHETIVEIARRTADRNLQTVREYEKS